MINKDMLNSVSLMLIRFRQEKNIPDTRILTPVEITEFLGGVCFVVLQHEGINNKNCGVIYKEDISDIDPNNLQDEFDD